MRQLLFLVGLSVSSMSYSQAKLPCKSPLCRMDSVYERLCRDERIGSRTNLEVCYQLLRYLPAAGLDTAASENYHAKCDLVVFYTYMNRQTIDCDLKMPPKIRWHLFDSLKKTVLRHTENPRFAAYSYALLGLYEDLIQDDTAKAEAWYRLAFSKGPTAEIYCWRMNSYTRWLSLDNSSRLDPSLRDSLQSWFEISVRKKPRYARPYAGISLLYASEGDVPKALEFDRKAIQLDPYLATAYNYEGIYYGMLKMTDSCIYTYRQLLLRFPNYLKARINLADYYKENAGPGSHAYFYYKEAFRQYDTCSMIDPYNPKHLLDAGDVLQMHLKDDAEALKWFKKAVDIDSTASVGIGNYYFMRNEYSQAIPYYRLAITAAPTSARYCVLAMCYENMDTMHYAQALECLKKSLELDPNYTMALSRLASLYTTIDEYDSSIAAYKRLIAVNPSRRNMSAAAAPYLTLLSKIPPADYKAKAILLKDCAKLGNRGCGFLYNGMVNEYGLENSQVNGPKAKEWYMKAGRVYPFSSMGFKGILRLYESGKIPMDKEDDSVWYKMDHASVLHYSSSMMAQDSSTSEYTFYFFTYYPPGVHPLDWEAERMKIDFNVTMDKDIYSSFGKLWQISRAYNLSFDEVLRYAISSIRSQKKASSIRHLDSLVDEHRSRYKRTGNIDELDSMVALYDLILPLEPEDSIKKEALHAFTLRAGINWEKGKRDESLLDLERGLRVDSTDKQLVRTAALEYSVTGRWLSARRLYDAFRYESDGEDPPTSMRVLFQRDVIDWDQKHPGNPDMEKARHYLYSATELVRLGQTSYPALLDSSRKQLVFEAGKHYSDMPNKDSISESFPYFEKLTGENAAYNDKYLDVLARWSEAGGDLNRAGGKEKIQQLLSRSEKSDLEKQLLLYRLRYLGAPELERRLEDTLQACHDKSDWIRLYIQAVTLKSISRDTARIPANPAFRRYAARRSADMYLFLYHYMQADSTALHDKAMRIIAEGCGEYAYTFLLNGDPEYGLKVAQMAHEADSSEYYARTNLPPALLLTNNFEKARRLYVAWAPLPAKDDRRFKDVFLQDIADLKEHGIVHPDFEKIVSILNDIK